MSTLFDTLNDSFSSQTQLAQTLIALALLVVLAFGLKFLVRAILLRLAPSIQARALTRFGKLLGDERIIRRAAYLIPALVIQLGVGLIPHLPATAHTIIRNVALAVTVLHAARLITLLLTVLQEHSERDASAQNRPRSYKSYVQLLNLIIYIGAAIIIIATLIDRSPLIVLSGMGAMSAVLMLVFKDTILSFTAGVLIASNDMLRIGDWIEMPQVGADGAVTDIALHTVKVQNWDMTITTIPTWRLMSESYRNWRGMRDSGGRRIKRALLLDASSVRFLDDSELLHLSRINILRDYLDSKLHDISASNEALQSTLGELGAEPANRRRLTNIGTFRAYALAYLRQHPGVHQNMLLMARTLEATPQGIPLELYCFTATVAWVEYEAIQGDIFDHLFAILPEFGLRLYQNPSGLDFRQLQAPAAGASHGPTH